MKFVLKIFLLLFIFSSQNLLAESNIVFINVDKIINQSNLGKKFNKQLDDSFKEENEALLLAKKKSNKKKRKLLNKKIFFLKRS